MKFLFALILTPTILFAQPMRRGIQPMTLQQRVEVQQIRQDMNRRMEKVLGPQWRFYMNANMDERCPQILPGAWFVMVPVNGRGMGRGVVPPSGRGRGMIPPNRMKSDTGRGG